MDPTTALRAIAGGFAGQRRTIALDDRSYPVLIRPLAGPGVIVVRDCTSPCGAPRVRAAEDPP
jgi:hypothetical protein